MRLLDAGEGDIRGQWPHPGEGRSFFLAEPRSRAPLAAALRCAGWPQAL